MSAFGGFGSTNTNTNAGGGLFGSNPQQQQGQQQQQQPAGNLFGSTTGTTGGGLFGSTNNNTTTGTAQPLGAQPTLPANAFATPNTNTNTNTGTNTGGGLFGSTNTGNTGGGLFGSTTSTNPGNAGGGLFGSNTNTNAGGGLFGNTQNTGAAGGGLFGSSAANNTGGGMFGSTNPNNTTNTAGGGLFGNNNTNSATGTAGGGLFGSTNNTTGTTGGGLFGSTNNNNTGGGLFGSNTQQNNNTGGGLFGSTNNNAGGGLFGAKPAGTGLFGSTAGTGTGGGLFGSTNNQQQQQQQGGGGLFGQSTLGVSALGNTLRPAASTNMSDAQTQYVRLTEKVEMVMNAWNPASPHCRFQHAFYNLVDPNEVARYVRPQNALNDAVWEKAVRENPDPSCFVPVIAIGFDDIRDRVEAQSTQATEQSQKLADLKTRLSSLESRHSVSNVARLQRAVATQTQITHRLLRMVQHLHLLIPAVRSSAIRPEEEALRTRLEEIEDELRKGRVKSKVNELWALVGAVSASVERGSRGASGEWAVVDEEGMAQIVQVLKDQQNGLAYLTKVLQKAKADMAIVLGQSPNEELTLPEEENLWGSTSTLRASALR